MPTRSTFLFSSVLLTTVAASQTTKDRPLGVSDPRVRIPVSKLAPAQTFSTGRGSDWIAIDTDIWVSIKQKNTIARIDPKANEVVQLITTLNKPCSGLAIGFGSLWVPNCGNSTLARIDLATGAVTQNISVGIADSEGGLATGAGSVWLLSDKKSVLTRIDPATNSTTANISLPEGCYSAAFGFGAVWVSCTKQNTVVRVDPGTNKPVATITTGLAPRFLSAGENGVWTLNQGDGTISRISPETNKVEATIAAGLTGEGGDISAADGAVWATLMGVPLTRIDPATNKIVQQFIGDGGDAVRAGHGIVFLSNYKTGIEWLLHPAEIFAVKP